MDRLAFEKLVQSALLRLPRKFREKIENMVVEVEGRPPDDLLDDMGIDQGTLFGLYQGVPLTEREWNYGNMLPDRIVIYQQPVEEAASSLAEIEEIVMETVIHEIGHYFGFRDDELYRIERLRSENKRKG